MATLEGWVKDIQGGFDVIVDDGGDQNQTLASFTVLLQKALKPGGVYVIEDMHVSRRVNWRGTGPIMLDVLCDWQESLLTVLHLYPLRIQQSVSRCAVCYCIMSWLAST